MLRWWRERRLSRKSIEADATLYMARHGRYARTLARLRSIDAYFLGDLIEQERWGRIREEIEERERALRLGRM
jgi:hypothetical protein